MRTNKKILDSTIRVYIQHFTISKQEVLVELLSPHSMTSVVMSLIPTAFNVVLLFRFHWLGPAEGQLPCAGLRVLNDFWVTGFEVMSGFRVTGSCLASGSLARQTSEYNPAITPL